MVEKKLREMTDDEVFARWQKRLDRVQTELTYLFATRRKFFDIQEMFGSNEELNAIGSQAYEWLLGIWGRDAVMAVRRELDNDSNTIAFGTLLDEMADRPRVLTRRRYLSFLKKGDEDLKHAFNEEFERYRILRPNKNRGDDHLNPDGIASDRRDLNEAAQPVLEYANRLIAHRTPIDKLALTVRDVNKAIDAIEPIFKKYHVLLTGKALHAVEPENIGDDWTDVFKFPWCVKPTL